MKTEELFAYIDHTALKACTTWEEIQTLCKEALSYHMASVCIPACYVKRAHDLFPELNICTVVGFPLGYSSTEVKLAETKQALEDGAREIDMVINLCDVKNRDFAKVKKEINSLKNQVGSRILKVIIETCYLDKEEKIAMCGAVTQAGADYIKTSTGFSNAGAVFADVALMREHVGPQVKIKAAGGISGFEDAEEFIRLGADRLGTSRLGKLMKSSI